MATEDKPSRNEEEYFARQNAELIAKMREQRDAERASAATAAMTCPRCGGTLVERVHHSVKIDECASCGGTWLDKGELAILERTDETSRRSFLGGLFNPKD
ncbi:zf-TFIIB domain-containing protein [Roseisolibacter sp. H3M3-2]|uniref:TFIIB-type zinc ribbon-containing protein n=1 Tax=Roseisolibacter sp. H3M3-2 TaxID=3031323 RepID=UPI0023DB3651|nr:zf-TFIIB domain-containing protein [Roseisolibacter sp. H3M3-2]MDF1501519.1 zf-TFIIB domain-containing protein [Roseisolibacter sp. H3M3-2]